MLAPFLLYFICKIKPYDSQIEAAFAVRKFLPMPIGYSTTSSNRTPAYPLRYALNHQAKETPGSPSRTLTTK